MATKALLVGVNKYQHVPGLRGCVNDVINLRGVLNSVRGVPLEDIRVVINERATKAAILERLVWLVRDVRPGDTRIFHFSGHGSQVRDRGELDELKDHLDEIICPYDMDWDDNFITDDELERVLKVPDGVLLEVILDCCHSGESAASPAGEDDLEPSSGSRFLRPPFDIRSRHEGRGLPALRHLLERKPATLWSACSDSQTAADASIEDGFNGAFTYFLCKNLRETSSRANRAQLLARVRESLRQARFSQVPQLRAEPAAADAPFFLVEGDQT